VVDDEEDVREVMTIFLSAQGYNVLSADCGKAAISLAANTPEKIDVLVTDAVMPGMDGPKLARILRETRPETKILYISGYTEDPLLFGSGLVLGEAFLQKPFPLDALAQKIRSLFTD
jgi:two-component system cell cycle sensor histidine kinase/response regulator CckA